MRKIIIAGNWKMNKTKPEAVELATQLKASVGSESVIEVVLCPPMINVAPVVDAVAGTTIKVGVQNISNKESGAYTGETSASMIKEAGCQYVIIGHSERREYYDETNQLTNEKVKITLKNNLTPILCIGETLAQREDNVTFAIIETQLKEGLKDISAADIAQGKKLVLAYEPVWAIGTGKVATPEQAQEVHRFIREKLTEIYSQDVAQAITIQYGGSVKPDNVKELIGQTDIDGALVGGASLKADSFTDLVNFSKTAQPA